MSSVHFDPTATRTFAALVLRRCIQGPIALVLATIVVTIFFIKDYALHVYSHLTVASILLVFSYLIVKEFIEDKLENDNQPPLSRNNAACLLSFHILAKLKSSTKNAYDVLEAATTSQRGQFILHEMGLTKERLLSVAEPETETEDVLLFLAEATKSMHTLKRQKIDAGVVLYAFFTRTGIFEDLLNSLDLSVKDLEMIVQWEEFHNQVWTKEPWWSPVGLVRTFGGMGRTLVMGFNNELDRITKNISQGILYRHKKKVTIHLDRIKDALLILNRSTNHNLIVTGQTGSGKRTFVENIARELRKQEVKKSSSYTNVLVLQAQDLLSGNQDPDQFLLKALNQATKSGRFILVIENIGLFLQGSDARIEGVLSKFLEAKQINIIGLADTRDYHSLIKTKPALDSQFEKILLEPTNYSDTMSVLMEEYFGIEDHSHTHVTYKALKAIVDLADRYIPKVAFPGKAIDLLHDTVQNATKKHDAWVTEDDVRDMVSMKAHMNVAKISEVEKDVLQSLADTMRQQIVGQDFAIDSIVNALKRARADISVRKRPIGSFLFLGPTGVGKTQTAKVLAEEYFGQEANMIRLDMNEYSSPDAINAIIGSTDPRYMAEGFLTRQVQDRPFSLILLDEIEKADKKVLDAFLQILDEGHLIDGQGVKTDFRNSIIIATSNAGAAYITDFLQKHENISRDEFKQALISELIKTKQYSPEFLNRFDDVILYSPLSKQESINVAIMMISDILHELEENKGISVQIETDAVEYIAERGYSAKFGAREMRRAITDTLETHIANRMLGDDLKRGDEIYIRRSDLEPTG